MCPKTLSRRLANEEVGQRSIEKLSVEETALVSSSDTDGPPANTTVLGGSADFKKAAAHGRPRTNWSGVVKHGMDLRKMGLIWKEVEAADKNGVGVWPNKSAWKQVT